MKRNIILSISGFLFIIGLHFQANSQTNCYAAFQVDQNPSQDSIWFVDYSFTTDSLTDYINSWTWTVTGMGVSMTFNVQNPVFFYNFFPQGYYTICLTIGTANGCMNTFCQQGVFLGGNTPCPIIINAQVYHVSVPNGSDGAVDITVSNGTPPYNYIWNTGANSEDIYFLPSGVYSVTVSDANCSKVFSTSVLEPYDSTITYYDTLLVPPIDTCFGFVPDSFYISNAVINGNSVIITWTFTGNGLVFTLPVTYTFNAYGNYIVAVTINCNDKSFTSTYMSYVRLYQGMSVEEYNSAIQIFPNPAHDKIYLNGSHLIETVLLYNITGSLVDTYSGQNVIDLSHFESGLYTVVIVAGKAKVMKKLIISK